MSDESSDRATADPFRPPAREVNKDSWIERLKLALGLRAPHSVRDDLADALAEPESEEAPDFTQQERTILRNVLGLRDVRIAKVMVPRADVIALPQDAPLWTVIETFRGAGHSRLPVYDETLDDPKGMVHIRDLFGALLSPSKSGDRPVLDPDILSKPLSTFDLVRPVLFAPSGMQVVDLLVRMQAQRIHMALVIDEYGGTDGLVSLEDLVETIVGAIEDEHDDEETPLEFERDDQGRLVVDARLSVALVARALGIDLTIEAAEREVDSIGGLATAMAGRVPAVGEVIEGPLGTKFTVLEADRRRLKRVAVEEIGASRPAAGRTDETGPAAPDGV